MNLTEKLACVLYAVYETERAFSPNGLVAEQHKKASEDNALNRAYLQGMEAELLGTHGTESAILRNEVCGAFMKSALEHIDSKIGGGRGW